MHRFSADQDSFDSACRRLHAGVSCYNLKKPPEWPLQGLNAYLFLGHFPVKKKLKISITFCPVETSSSVRHARIHNLCCQQFSNQGAGQIGVNNNARTPLLKFRSHMCSFLFHLVVTRDHGKLKCVFNLRFFLQILGAINDSKMIVMYYQRIPKPTLPFRNVFQSK